MKFKRVYLSILRFFIVNVQHMQKTSSKTKQFYTTMWDFSSCKYLFVWLQLALSQKQWLVICLFLSKLENEKNFSKKEIPANIFDLSWRGNISWCQIPLGTNVFHWISTNNGHPSSFLKNLKIWKRSKNRKLHFTGGNRFLEKCSKDTPFLIAKFSTMGGYL